MLNMGNTHQKSASRIKYMFFHLCNEYTKLINFNHNN